MDGTCHWLFFKNLFKWIGADGFVLDPSVGLSIPKERTSRTVLCRTELSDIVSWIKQSKSWGSFERRLKSCQSLRRLSIVVERIISRPAREVKMPPQPQLLHIYGIGAQQGLPLFGYHSTMQVSLLDPGIESMTAFVSIGVRPVFHGHSPRVHF